MEPDFDATGSKIIVKRNEVNPGGLIKIPKTAKSVEQREGEVLGKGPECTEGFDIGDQIIFGQYSGVEIPRKIDDQTYDFLLMEECDVLGVVHKNGNGAAKQEKWDASSTTNRH